MPGAASEAAATRPSKPGRPATENDPISEQRNEITHSAGGGHACGMCETHPLDGTALLHPSPMPQNPRWLLAQYGCPKLTPAHCRTCNHLHGRNHKSRGHSAPQRCSCCPSCCLRQTTVRPSCRHCRHLGHRRRPRPPGGAASATPCKRPSSTLEAHSSCHRTTWNSDSEKLKTTQVCTSPLPSTRLIESAYMLCNDLAS